MKQPAVKPNVPLILLIVAAVAIPLVIFWTRMMTGMSFDGLAVGAEAPPIEGAGWVNGSAPTPESLKGKVIVVDAWASW